MKVIFERKIQPCDNTVVSKSTLDMNVQILYKTSNI